MHAVEQVDERPGGQDAAPAAQRRPQPVGDAGDSDDLPFAAHRGMRRDHRHRLGGDALGTAVAGNLQLRQVVDDGGRARGGQIVGERSGRLEHRDHGVQIAVGLLADRTTT